jgi:hypothetical protein
VSIFTVLGNAISLNPSSGTISNFKLEHFGACHRTNNCILVQGSGSKGKLKVDAVGEDVWGAACVL